MTTWNGELFADYFQFYLQDEGAESDNGNSWTDEAVEQLLDVSPGIINVGTVRNMDVSVSVEVLEAAPPVDFDYGIM